MICPKGLYFPRYEKSLFLKTLTQSLKVSDKKLEKMFDKIKHWEGPFSPNQSHALRKVVDKPSKTVTTMASMAAGKTNKTRQLIGKHDHQMLGVSQASDFKEIVNSLKEINSTTPQTLVNLVSEYHIEVNFYLF